MLRFDRAQRELTTAIDRSTFAREVVLDEHLPCAGVECAVDTARVVQLVTNRTNMTWFEYVRPPCVDLAFFNGARQVSARQHSDTMCADPREIVGIATCAPPGWGGITGWKSDAICEYYGERVTYATNEARCAADDAYDGIGDRWSSIQEDCTTDWESYHWTSGPCELLAQVRSCLVLSRAPPRGWRCLSS